MNDNILGFKQLPTSLVYAFDEPDDKISVLNKLVNQFISEHAPIKRAKFTRRPAPWWKIQKSLRLKMSLIIYKPNHMIWIILT